MSARFQTLVVTKLLWVVAHVLQDQQLKVHCHSNHSQHANRQQKGPNFSLLDPAIQQQWDYPANAHLGPINIKPQSARMVQWV